MLAESLFAAPGDKRHAEGITLTHIEPPSNSIKHAADTGAFTVITFKKRNDYRPGRGVGP